MLLFFISYVPDDLNHDYVVYYLGLFSYRHLKSIEVHKMKSAYVITQHNFLEILMLTGSFQRK
jgi:hypothetical protein